MVKNERFEPHPVSNEVEVDWEGEVGVQYRRVDEETLQSRVALTELGLAVRLVWCVGDEGGNDGGNGWRIGEVLVVEDQDESWGSASIAEAEVAASSSSGSNGAVGGSSSKTVADTTEEEDGDDDYWAQYDNTPAQTPGPNDTRHTGSNNSNVRSGNGATDEESYYAQYSSVQPAMDNHDPDEAQENGPVESSLGKEEVVASHFQSQLASHHDPELHNTSQAWSEDASSNLPTSTSTFAQERDSFVAHPRPGSSHGSSGSDTVARLEKAAATEEGNGDSRETGIKQHIGTSIKSLWRLARVVGMEREEFERVVRTELECIGMMDDDE